MKRHQHLLQIGQQLLPINRRNDFVERLDALQEGGFEKWRADLCDISIS